MKLLIDIGHPGHVHLFKNLAWILNNNGHEVLFSVRLKGENILLLKEYGFHYFQYGKSKKGIISKLIGLFTFNFKLQKIFNGFQPDISISHSSFYLSQISKLNSVPNITLEDTGNIEQVILYRYFADYILTSNSFHRNYGEKQIKYNGFHELAYLHPNYFRPVRSIRKDLDLSEEKEAVLFRFVSWNASHDIGRGGFSLEEKIKLVEELEKKYRVFISSESPLPRELEKFKLQTRPDQIHDVMAQMSLFIGEGATMASECAVLGVPSIYINTMDAGTIDDQEKHGLLYHFKSSKGVIEKALDILEIPNGKELFQERRKKILSDKIDVTAFLVWFIENYPESAKIMKENPDYQQRFM